MELVHIKPPYFDDLIGNVILVHEDYLANNKDQRGQGSALHCQDRRSSG